MSLRPAERVWKLAGGTYHALEFVPVEALERGLRDTRSVVFLHGFPDHPPTAVPFLRELAARGFRVLAPWMPGYAPSPTTGSMGRERVTRDLIDIIDAWNRELPDPGTVDLVGHDWGAVVTYVLSATSPERIRRAVTMAVPHPRTFLRQLRTPAQLLMSWYMLLFQLPGAGHIVAARDFALIDRLWRDWSPGYTLPEDDPLTGQSPRTRLHECLAASMPAPIRWYRAMARDTQGVRLFDKPLTTPLLYLHGANDGCIHPPTADDSRRFAGEYRHEVIAGRGHFLHLEDPSGIAARVCDWLT